MPTPKRTWPYRSVFEALLKPHAPHQVPTVAPSVGIFDSPATITPINREWLGYVLGVADILTELDAWEGSPEEIYEARSKITEFLYRLAEGESVKDWRVNPSTCHFEVQLYNSDDWLDRGKLCGGSLANKMSQADALYQADLRYADQDTENPRAVNSSAPDVTWNSASDDEPGYEEYREQGLCQACVALVDALCVATIDAIEQNADVVNAVFNVVDVAAAAIGVGGVFSFGILAIIGVCLASFSELARFVYTIGKDWNLDALKDEDARENMACCMYNRLKDQPVDIDYFKMEVYDQCDTVVINPFWNSEAWIASMLNFAVRDEMTFWAFLDLCTKYAADAEIGALEACPCAEPFMLVGASIWPGYQNLENPSTNIWVINSDYTEGACSVLGFESADGINAGFDIVENYGYSPPAPAGCNSNKAIRLYEKGSMNYIQLGTWAEAMGWPNPIWRILVWSNTPDFTVYFKIAPTE
jgi:hypothetical protein